MSERPFMQLYVSDFVGDTLLLSAEHIGAYLLLLIALWNADGNLPNDEVKLARVGRMPVESWRLIWSELVPFFEVTDEAISHQRLSRDLLRFASKSLSRSEAGRKGGKAKSLKDKNTGLAIAMPVPQHLPEPYRKNGATLSDPTEEMVRLDRNANAPLFEACEALTAPVPDFMTGKSWPASLIAKARASIKSQESVH